MASYISSQTGTWDDASTWGGGGFPVAGDAATILTGHTVTLDSNEECALLTIDSGGVVDMSTYDLVNSGDTLVNGTLTMGVSGSSGLTCVNLTFGTGSVSNLQDGSLINISGNYLCAVNVWSVNYRGTLTVTGSGTYSSSSYNNQWHAFIQNSGVTTTVTSNTWISCVYSDGQCTVNGTITTAGQYYTIRIGSGSSFTLGANGNFVSPHHVRYSIDASAGLTWGRATAISCGTFLCLALGTENSMLICRNVGTVSGIEASSTSAVIVVPSGGTLFCSSFIINQLLSGSITVNGGLNNPSYSIDGDVQFYNYGTFSLTWNAGTGSFSLTGSSGTDDIDFNGKTVEGVSVDASGAIKSVINDFGTAYLSGSGGTIKSSVAGTQRAVTVSSTGTMSNCSIQDINLGSANMVNAKSNCINLGNNSGFIFTDTLII